MDSKTLLKTGSWVLGVHATITSLFALDSIIFSFISSVFILAVLPSYSDVSADYIPMMIRPLLFLLK